MLSQLGPLFKATFRHAEESDTRQNLPHAVNKDGRRKSDDPQPDTSDMWEDSTGVSVAALRAFLINFLNGTARQTGKAAAGAMPGDPETAGTRADGPAPEQRKPVNTATARAVGAYQSMADKLDPHPPPAPAITAGDAPITTDADLVSAADLRLMHQLIGDLETLETGGVSILTLEKAESFLQSLKNAIDRAMGR